MAIAKIWRNRIEAGTQSFTDCPEKYKAMVLQLMREDVASGKITAEEFEELTGEPYDG